jgi:hypothetical protein
MLYVYWKILFSGAHLGCWMQLTGYRFFITAIRRQKTIAQTPAQKVAQVTAIVRGKWQEAATGHLLYSRTTSALDAGGLTAGEILRPDLTALSWIPGTVERQATKKTDE